MLAEKSFIGLGPGRYQLSGSAIIDRATDSPVIKAERQSGTSLKDRYYLRIRDANLPYFMHDKTLGSIDEKILKDIAWSNVDLAQQVSDTETHAAELEAGHYELAASALTEAALRQTFLTDNLIEGVDERLALIELAGECLDLAISALPAEQNSSKHRLQVKQLFTQVHRDLICGEITQATVDELTQNLYAELLNTIENVDEVHARGLAGELRAYWHYWCEYPTTGLVAIPATIRGDSGFYNRQDTHDIDVLSQKSDGNWRIETPREIKRRRIAQWMLDRYTGADLVYVSPLQGVVTVQKATQVQKLER